MKINLSVGTLVLKDVYTHGMDRAFMSILTEEERVTAGTLYKAYEAVLPLMVESLDGKPFACTPEWLDSLSKKDFTLLKEAVDTLEAEEPGKKNP